MSNSFFHFKSFSIYKQTKGLKVGTDACVLGALAQFQNAKTILDIGTGSGILALMMAQKHPEAKILAIEKTKAIAEQAQFNVQSSAFADQIQVIERNILELESEQIFDGIIANPPYFDNHLKGQEPSKNNAMHIEDLHPEKLLNTCFKLMHEHSTMWLIYPANTAVSVLNYWQSIGGFILEQIHVYERGNKHIRTILCLGLKPGESQLKQIVLKTETGEISEAFRQLMQDFYLENTDVYKAKKQAD